jgi:hypothetical protein
MRLLSRNAVAVVAIVLPSMVGAAAAAADTPRSVGAAVLRASTTTGPGGTTAETIELDPALARALLDLPPEGSARVESWPLAPAVRGSVVLTRHDIYAAGARILTYQGGKEVELPRSSLVFFWGPGENDAFTRALLWIDPATLAVEGVSASLDGTFQLLPPAKTGGNQMLADSDALRAPDGTVPTWSCGNGEAQHRATGAVEKAARDFAGPAGAVFSTLQKLTVAVDTDTQFMSLKMGNDTTNATNYIAALIANVTLIYERDFNIRLLQGTTFLRPPAADPYVQNCGGNACGLALDEFSDYWSTNYVGVNRGLAMMLSGKQPTSSSASGIAWIEGLCDTFYGYSFNQLFTVSYPATNLVSLEAKLVGHELGHNHGSVHTHCTQPNDVGPIDMCNNTESLINPSCYSGPVSCPAPGTYQGVPNVTGTIMSYCHLTPPGCASFAVFHPRTLTNIGPYVQSNASGPNACISPFAPPVNISINDPQQVEGNAGNTLVYFNVTLSAPSTQTVTVNYVTADGTATAGSDYVPRSGTLTFLPGQTVETAIVTVKTDTTVEPDETFVVNLSGASGGTITDSQGQATIKNDDSAAAAAAVPQYRLFYDVTHEHLYTVDQNEYTFLGAHGWLQEGQAYQMFTSTGSYNGVFVVPLFRLYHPGSRQHLWSTDANEATVLGETPDWIYEGITGYILPVQVTGTTPLYRMFLSGLAVHLWTTDQNEYDFLGANGWVKEGAIGYVIP